MDSLEIFTQLPVDPEAYYLVGLQVYGVPGFDFLSPIGTSGVTIAAAFNPCVGGWTQPLGGPHSSPLMAGRQAVHMNQCRPPFCRLLKLFLQLLPCRGLLLCICGAAGGHQSAHPRGH